RCRARRGDGGACGGDVFDPAKEIRITAMFKLLSRLFSSTGAKSGTKLGYQELEELAEQGLFKPQYVIPIQLEDHPILKLIQDKGLFDLKSPDNQLML